jgi:rhamnose transport system substrate-binding protein
MVSKDILNPYMQKAYDGFEAACREIGVESLFEGAETATPEGQIEVIERLITKDVSLIAVAANDADALYAVLKKAIGKGIKVISFDSAVNKDSRLTHVQQANPEKIGRVLVQAAYEMVDGEGGIAILSATRQATNQKQWIEWMEKELDENTGKYAKTSLIQIVYGDDEPVKSADAARELLRNPEIKVIIAPTAVGMLAAGTYLQENNSGVLLTGLGLPSEMAPFIENGICPWMYLWNPVDLGYLTAYTGDALVNGQITGEAGDSFFAGSMGERVITKASDGGTEVMLGDPFKFDKINIAEWKEVY